MAQMPKIAAIINQVDAASQTSTDIASTKAKTTAITDAAKSTVVIPFPFIFPPNSLAQQPALIICIYIITQINKKVSRYCRKYLI